MFIAQPLYRVKKGKSDSYVYSRELAQLQKSARGCKHSIQRFRRNDATVVGNDHGSGARTVMQVNLETPRPTPPFADGWRVEPGVFIQENVGPSGIWMSKDSDKV